MSTVDFRRGQGCGPRAISKTMGAHDAAVPQECPIFHPRRHTTNVPCRFLQDASRLEHDHAVFMFAGTRRLMHMNRSWGFRGGLAGAMVAVGLAATLAIGCDDEDPPTGGTGTAGRGG